MKKVSVLRLGHLLDELNGVADRVLATLAEDSHTVWVDDDNRIFAHPSGVAPEVPPHWVAGTYGFGQPRDDIVDDLRAVLRERMGFWIID